MDERKGWTLDELAARVAVALSEGGYEGAPNARVREVPDERVIRYYTTLGLVDRPTYEGRVAKYGPRHLKQIVAIKRLQSEGLTLSQVQARLAGIAPAALTRLARVPDEAEEKEVALEKKKPVEPPANRARFWAAQPAAPRPVSSLVGVPVAEGVTVLVAATRPLSGEDVDAVKEAAGPMLEMLAKRGIIQRGEK